MMRAEMAAHCHTEVVHTEAVVLTRTNTTKAIKRSRPGLDGGVIYTCTLESIGSIDCVDSIDSILVPQNRPPAFTPQRQRAIVPRCRWGGDEGAAPIVTVQSPGMTLANVVTRFMALAIIPLPIP